MLVIDTDAPGVVLERRFESLDGSHHAAFRFDAVPVPADHIIGRAGEGLPRAMRQIGDTRLLIAAEAVGLARWAIEFTTQHLKAPHHSGEPLGAREGVRLRYADLRIRTYAARSMLYRTARLGESGANIVNEGIACKVYATETLSDVVDGAIQLVGGKALTVGHPLEQLYRRGALAAARRRRQRRAAPQSRARQPRPRQRSAVMRRTSAIVVDVRGDSRCRRVRVGQNRRPAASKFAKRPRPTSAACRKDRPAVASTQATAAEFRATKSDTRANR